MKFIYLFSVLFAIPLLKTTNPDEKGPSQLPKDILPKVEINAIDINPSLDEKAMRRAANARRSQEFQEKTRLLKEIKTQAMRENTARKQFLLEKKMAKIRPTSVHPVELPASAELAGHHGDIAVKYSEAFVEKHLGGGIGSGIGNTKSVIRGKVVGFEQGHVIDTSLDNVKRITLTSLDNVHLDIFHKTKTGEFIPHSTQRGRVQFSGFLKDGVAVIDHFSKTLPSTSHIRSPLVSLPNGIKMKSALYKIM